MNTIAPDTLPQAQLIDHLLERYHAPTANNCRN